MLILLLLMYISINPTIIKTPNYSIIINTIEWGNIDFAG